MTMETPIRSALTDPDILFSQDLMADPALAPQLSDPRRVASIKVYLKGTYPNRPPDISTPRTDVYIVGWREKDPNDSFFRDDPSLESENPE